MALVFPKHFLLCPFYLLCHNLQRCRHFAPCLIVLRYIVYFGFFLCASTQWHFLAAILFFVIVVVCFTIVVGIFLHPNSFPSRSLPHRHVRKRSVRFPAFEFTWIPWHNVKSFRATHDEHTHTQMWEKKNHQHTWEITTLAGFFFLLSLFCCPTQFCFLHKNRFKFSTISRLIKLWSGLGASLYDMGGKKKSLFYGAVQ